MNLKMTKSLYKCLNEAKMVLFVRNVYVTTSFVIAGCGILPHENDARWIWRSREKHFAAKSHEAETARKKFTHSRCVCSRMEVCIFIAFPTWFICCIYELTWFVANLNLA